MFLIWDFSSIPSLRFLTFLIDTNLSSAVGFITKFVSFLCMKVFGMLVLEIYVLLYPNLALEVTVVNPNIAISGMMLQLVLLEHNFHYQMLSLCKH